jgi:CBS domain containing-hemolysin-like protein
MTATPVLSIVGFILFGGASFFFALAETALFTLGPWQTRQLAERDPARGARVARLLAEPEDLLATLVLGNTFANAGLVLVALWMVLHAGWPAAATVLGTFATLLVVGEVIPKTLAVRVPGFWAVRVAPPMRFFLSVSRPVRRVAQRLNELLLQLTGAAAVNPATTNTTEDYAELLELGFQQGALAQSEKEIILQIVTLDRRTAKDVMKPRARMRGLPDDLSIEDMIAAARRLKHRRLPLYDGTPDTIVGILNTQKLLLDPHADLMEAIEFPSFVPETINLLQLLKRLQRQKRGVAIVLDEYGSTAGIVTMEDILGTMVGHLRPESEPEGFVMAKLGPGRWRVNGTMRLEDFRREYPELGEVPGVDTMAGLMLELAEVVPAEGTTVVFRGLRLTATVTDERRVRELSVETLRKGGA